MAKKKTEQPKSHYHQDIPADPVVPVEGQVVLLGDSVDAKGKACPAGMVIAPDVEGWPAHRVENHVRNKKAK